MTFSCSTCWNSHRHQDGRPMLREILDLGFERVELGHGIRITLMEGIQKFFSKGKVRFSSLHNFCPLPVEITRAAPDCYQLSAANTYERQRAIKHTKQTIDFAQRLEAPLVVLHLGSVPMNSYTEELITLAKQGKQFTREYVSKKIEAVKVREKKAPAFVRRSIDALKELAPYAADRGIKLGIEGRFAYEEIPSEREHLRILEEFDPSVVGYWHDFGHIQTKHNLGFLDHAEWLRMVARRFFGGHLHDTEWPDGDHKAPFTGGINYDELIPILPKDTTLVWEMSPRRKTEEIQTSFAKWKARFGESTSAPAPSQSSATATDPGL